MFRFTIRDVLWLMVVVGMGIGWWASHRQPAIAKPRTIEGWFFFSPDRADFVAEMYLRDGDGFGEVFREKGVYYVEIVAVPGSDGPKLRLNADDFARALEISLKKLRERE